MDFLTRERFSAWLQLQSSQRRFSTTAGKRRPADAFLLSTIKDASQVEYLNNKVRVTVGKSGKLEMPNPDWLRSLNRKLSRRDSGVVSARGVLDSLATVN